MLVQQKEEEEEEKYVCVCVFATHLASTQRPRLAVTHVQQHLYTGRHTFRRATYAHATCAMTMNVINKHTVALLHGCV